MAPSRSPETDGSMGENEPQARAQRNANLARIRDNQRRSRARRKEYLTELETKYRHCEQAGVEASAEIQAAARKVVEENKKLRLLLKQHGLSDAEIEGIAGEESSAAAELDDMLSQRRHCGSGSTYGSDSGQRRESSASVPPQSAPQRLLMPLQPLQPAARYSGRPDAQYRSPHPAASPGVPTQQYTDTRTTSYGAYDEAAAPASQHVPVQYGMAFDDPQAWSHLYQPPLQATAAGNSSCFAAADAIRSIKPDMGHELEQELGCDGTRECYVPNTHVFSIMDRYSEAGV